MERSHMSREDRAKQFMPFAALKGYEEALRKKEKIIVPGPVLSEEYKEELDRKLRQVKKNDMITVVASDAHNTDTRPPEVLVKAYNEIERLCGRQTVLEFIENADLICKA